jgi:REP element-mobilizing transposase RayT
MIPSSISKTTATIPSHGQLCPNHVHILLQPILPWTVAKIIASLKSCTGRQIAETLASEKLETTDTLTTPTKSHIKISDPESPGTARLQPRRHVIWFPEYSDRYIRNERHLRDAINYIHENPVKAGLISKPDQWPRSSAYQHRPDREAPASRAQEGDQKHKKESYFQR